MLEASSSQLMFIGSKAKSEKEYSERSNCIFDNINTLAITRIIEILSLRFDNYNELHDIHVNLFRSKKFKLKHSSKVKFDTVLVQMNQLICLVQKMRACLTHDKPKVTFLSRPKMQKCANVSIVFSFNYIQ